MCDILASGKFQKQYKARRCSNLDKPLNPFELRQLFYCIVISGEEVSRGGKKETHQIGDGNVVVRRKSMNGSE